MEPPNFLSVKENTGLILSTDGVPVFTSAKGSMWPVYLSLTSIPPDQRMRLNNIIIAGIWFGSRKPDIEKLLLPILSEINELSLKGVTVSIDGVNYNIKAKLVMCVLDLPARAAVANTVQFNGAFGCLYCTEEGVIRDHRRIYLPCEDYCLRTSACINNWGEAAEVSGEPVMGIKGHSVLVSSNLLELPQCIPIDYMHCVLEGIFKSLLKHWFEGKYRSALYSIRKDIIYINKAMLSIKPTSEIPRIPRPLSLMSFWKASEFRFWMLCSFPVLSEYLPSDYVHHLSLLVASIWVLLSDNISKSDLDLIDELLYNFQKLVPVMYTPLMCTANMHLLLHLVQIVRLWGPLWAFSMFGFENVNGYLGKLYHGTGQILKQITFHLRLQQTLPNLLNELKEKESEAAKLYIEKIIHPTHNNMYMVSPNIYIIGSLVCGHLTPEEVNAVSAAGIGITPGCSITRAHKCMINGIIYNSNQHTTCSTRNDSVCSFVDANGSVSYGVINSFCISAKTIPFCILTKYDVTTILPVTEIRSPQHPLLQKHATTCVTLLSRFMIGIMKLSLSDVHTVIVTPVKNILKKCIHVPMKGKYYDYLIITPNNFEMH